MFHINRNNCCKCDQALDTISVFFSLVVVSAGFCQSQDSMAKEKEFRIERSISEAGIACIQCHKQEHPGIFADWANSRHANANITCIDCHLAEEFDPDVSQSHYKQYEKSDSKYGRPEYKVPVAGVVTPKDCSRCHPDEAKEYAKSKHANTIEIIWKIDPWLNDGMNSDVERTTGCYYCHGTVLKTEDGELSSDTWPNVGVGRVNLDGSLGSCTSCHTRHRFSLMEARKPEACGQCHLGPDHPQIEIYMESKHGDIYKAFGDEYNWTSAPGTWSAGIDYRGPTCASCHMSGSGTVKTSHDVTERLSWELQAPLTVRPEDFAAFPAKTNWEVERNKMKEVCTQCHGNKWVNDHYIKLDQAIEEYNSVYFTPAKALLDELYEKGLLDKTRFFPGSGFFFCCCIFKFLLLYRDTCCFPIGFNPCNRKSGAIFSHAIVQHIGSHLGWTQQKIAEKVGISREMPYIAGHLNMDLATARAVKLTGPRSSPFTGRLTPPGP